jgi:hypothetical protein
MLDTVRNVSDYKVNLAALCFLTLPNFRLLYLLTPLPKGASFPVSSSPSQSLIGLSTSFPAPLKILVYLSCLVLISLKGRHAEAEHKLHKDRKIRTGR